MQANVVLRTARRTIYYDTQGATESHYTTYAMPAEDEILGEIVSTGKNKM